MKTAIVATVLLAALFAVPVRAADTIEYKLAVIDAGSHIPKNDLTVARFRSLLRQLSEKFIESRPQIADMTVKAQSILRDEGVQVLMLSMSDVSAYGTG